MFGEYEVMPYMQTDNWSVGTEENISLTVCISVALSWVFIFLLCIVLSIALYICKSQMTDWVAKQCNESL